MKNLYRADDELYKKWAKEFIDKYPKETDQLAHNAWWFMNKAYEEGYEIRYDDAVFDFWDYVCDLH